MREEIFITIADFGKEAIRDRDVLIKTRNVPTAIPTLHGYKIFYTIAGISSIFIERDLAYNFRVFVDVNGYLKEFAEFVSITVAVNFVVGFIDMMYLIIENTHVEPIIIK